MVKPAHDQEPRQPDEPEYRADIAKIAEEFEIELPERAINVAVDLLKQVYEKYGDPSSETYKPYHNYNHSIEVITRSFRLWRLMGEELSGKVNDEDYEIDDEGYELLLIAGAGHDIVVGSQGKEVGYDETESAKITARTMELAGYNEEQVQRVYDAILATTVERDVEGNITQSFVCQGSKDPMKLALATADINGTTMDGISTLVRHAAQLHAEITGIKVEDIKHNSEGFSNFLFTQAQFVSGRLAALKGDRLHYFSEEAEEKLEKAYEREFTGATRDVISLAKTLASFPEMTRMVVDKTLSTVVAGVGSTALSTIEALSKAFHRKKDN